MRVWRAATGAGVTVGAKFDNNGTGVMDLFQQQVGGAWVHIGGNNGLGDLSVNVAEPPNGRLELKLRTVAASIDGSALPVYVAVSQAGAILPADMGLGAPTNGPPPFRPVRMHPDAAFNAPCDYPFDVAFQ